MVKSKERILTQGYDLPLNAFQVLVSVTAWNSIIIIIIIIIIYDYTSNNWSPWNSNEELKEKVWSRTKKIFDRFITRVRYTWNITHNTENSAVWSLKPKQWGSPLFQEKHQEEKACDKRRPYRIIIITYQVYPCACPQCLLEKCAVDGIILNVITRRKWLFSFTILATLVLWKGAQYPCSKRLGRPHSISERSVEYNSLFSLTVSPQRSH